MANSAFKRGLVGASNAFNDLANNSLNERAARVQSDLIEKRTIRLAKFNQGIRQEDATFAQGLTPPKDTSTGLTKEANLIASGEGLERGTSEFDSRVGELITKFRTPTGKTKFDITDVRKAKKEVKSQRRFINNFVDIRNDLEENFKTRDAILGGTGKVARTLNSVKKQAEQLFNLVGFEVEGQDASKKELLNQKFDYGSLRSVAKEGSRARANLLNGAFALAGAQNRGGKLSDSDVQRALDQLAADQADPAIILSTIDDRINQQIKDYQRGYQDAFDESAPSTETEFPNFRFREEANTTPVVEATVGSQKPILKFNVQTGKIE